MILEYDPYDNTFALVTAYYNLEYNSLLETEEYREDLFQVK